MDKRYSRHHFTLVELLIVVGIIAVLAGLVLPAVIGGIQQGRITQAKSDLASIMMALKGVEGTYGKMVKANNDKKYKFNGKDAKDDTTNKFITLGTTDSEDAYNAFITELSVPGNSGLSSRNINARKIKFLEPKSSFNPGEAYTSQSNNLWRDPWGKPYILLINYAGLDEIVLLASATPHKKIATKAAGYSVGPNGKDDKGCNVDLNTCIYEDDKDNHKLHDDIATWH